MTSTEIELRQNGHVAERDIVDGWLAVASDVIKLANVIAPTDFVPEVYRDNPPAVAAAILTGRELGIGPLTSLRHVQVVKGTPTLSAEYKRARVLAAGHEFDVLELNTQRCRVSGRRRGSNKPPLEITFTMEDAKAAGLLAPSRSGKPGAWQTRPRRMLFARAGSELCDFLFADVVNGLPTAEVVADGTDDDEFAGYNEAATQAAAAAGDSEAGKGAPRTARRGRAANTPPAAPVTPPTGSEARGSADGPPLPPLPGEDEVPTSGAAATSATAQPSGEPSSEPSAVDERDYDSPGTVTTPQLSAIWTIFTKVYAFTAEEKDHARAVAAQIIGHPLTSTREMSRNEAKTVLDTLGNWQEIAHQRQETPRDVLVAMMAAGEDAAAGTGEAGHGDG